MYYLDIWAGEYWQYYTARLAVKEEDLLRVIKAELSVGRLVNVFPTNKSYEKMKTTLFDVRGNFSHTNKH